jgi:hypothetical protein
MNRARSISGFLLCILAMPAAPCAAADGASSPTVDAILTHMENARAQNRARFRPYKVKREYKLFGREQQHPKSQVIAAVSFVPPNSKKYAIEQTHGAGALGERIVRQMLEGEAEAMKHYPSTDITAANYDLELLRTEEFRGRKCYVLHQTPKRKEKNLLEGTIWVDAQTYMLQRFMGEPAKNPSWWLKDSRIVLDYAEVNGMWLQTRSEATANVRFFGPYTMVSRDLEYEMGPSGAQGGVMAAHLDAAP